MDQEEQRPAIKRYRRPRATLTEEDVAQVKAHLNEGTRLAILAMYFGVFARGSVNTPGSLLFAP
jgi:hypothetical protein